MTEVTFFKNKKGEIVGYLSSGHAGYAEAGEDIVCAAISVLTTTGVNALEAVCGVVPGIEIDEEAGYLEVILPYDLDENKRKKADIVLETILIGIKGIQDTYPDYIILKYEEV